MIKLLLIPLYKLLLLCDGRFLVIIHVISWSAGCKVARRYPPGLHGEALELRLDDSLISSLVACEGVWIDELGDPSVCHDFLPSSRALAVPARYQSCWAGRNLPHRRPPPR